MATEWTDKKGTTWVIQDDKLNFDDWVSTKFKEEYEVACVKWHAGDKSDMESLFAAWHQTTEATKKEV
jgi:hypothetical protein